jgi:hypothetical protein
MKYLLEATIPNDAGNRNLMSGKLLQDFQRYIDEVKPQAVYAAADGQRTIFFLVDLSNPEDLPSILEPLWIDLEADIRALPVLDGAEFERAIPGIMKVVEARK